MDQHQTAVGYGRQTWTTVGSLETWASPRSRAARCTECLQIYERRWPTTARRWPRGMTSHHWHAMSGSAGSRMPSSMKRDSVESQGRIPNWLKASAAHAAGLGAATGRRPVGRTVIDRFPRTISLIRRGGAPVACGEAVLCDAEWQSPEPLRTRHRRHHPADSMTNARTESTARPKWECPALGGVCGLAGRASRVGYN